ncbi:GTP-binding protein [Vibrio sp.]|nr:GTP-binding protein [Vibrio sp.]
MNKQSKTIPTNIITGFLGVGKTTTINSLLARKPQHETWAILVNEFGQVGIDQEMMPTQDGLYVKELTGGCICCSLGLSLGQTLTALIEQTRPDRLIIEPTGIGHPEGIIDTLMGPRFKDTLDLRATICLLDPRWLDQEEVIGNEIFHDQLNLADVVLINKCDIATEQQIQLAEDSLNNMFPIKQHIGRTTKGEIDLTLLDLVLNGQLKSQFPQEHHHHHHEHNHGSDTSPEPGIPVRKTGNGSGLFSCGWVFHREDCFDYWALESVLVSLPKVSRIKGVIRIGSAWVFFNRVKDEHDFDKVAYRRDSRIEIISSEELDWKQIEADMMACQTSK